MKLNDQVRNELNAELPTNDDPLGTWLALVLMGCVLVMLVMGVVTVCRHVTDEKPAQSILSEIRAVQPP
jgi:hypothetical protein